ncbi:hypothetical protein QTO34_005488 [Cnephaeus nilssonii]|uniref:Uncharacterized protein n=1 Tax=Cnephaeus nilssonii TaxID=3371016 RepID=A0AA40HPD7_CNENI|nr:hypothetical protein QTO34_005488 [Eptesicus nilssonii]
MFSCCLPVSPGRGLKRGSDGSRFRIGRRWFRTQRRPVSPLKWLEPESSTRVIKEQQLVDEDPGPAFFTEGQLGHSSEGQRRPKVHFASCGSGEPGPSTPAQEAEEAPAETPEVQTEESDEESDDELEAWAPPELLPPPSASPVAAVEPGPAWEAPADMTEAPPPLDEEPSLEPALGSPCPQAKSSTRVIKEQQLVDEDPGPAFFTEGQLGHSSEGQRRPKVHFASCGSGEPGPSSGRRWTPAQKPTRFCRPPTWNQRQNRVLSSILDPVFSSLLKSPKLPRKFPACAYMRPNAHGNHSWPEYLEPDEPEPKGEKHRPRRQRRLLQKHLKSRQRSDEESDEELEARHLQSSEGQRRPKVHFASCGSGEPGPSSGRRWTPAQKPTRFCRPPTWNQRQNRVLSSILDPDSSPRLESPRVPQKFPACAYMRPNAHGNHSWPESLEPEEAEPKAPAQEAEEAPAETPEVQTEASDEESDEELEARAPPEVLPPPSASPVAAVEPGPAWEAPADMTEAPPPLDEEPSLEPALGLPVSPGQGLKRGSDGSRFRIGRHWFRTQRRPVSPLTRLEPESSTRVIKEQQLVDEDPALPSSLRGPWVIVPRASAGPKCILPAVVLENQGPRVDGDGLLPRSRPAPAQEAEEAPAETPEVQTEASEEESDEELEARAPPEVLPPPSASPVAAVEPGPAWEAPADMTEAPPPLDEEPSLEPAQGPASEEELPPETPAVPAPEPQAEAARRLPSEKLVLPPLVDLFLLFSFLFMIFLSSWGYSTVNF